MKYSDMEVTLIDHMGTDDRVVDAARISFDKLASNYTPEQNEKLICYLARNNHWTPFAHCQLTFKIKAPIFVARQLGKHQVGLVWNEISRRYVDYEPEFWMPDTWRMRADNKKQGSLAEGVTIAQGLINKYYLLVDEMYSKLLDYKVAPELARIILPQNMMTEWYWTGSLYAFVRICRERMTEHAQKEAEDVAHKILTHLVDLYPVSAKYLLEDQIKRRDENEIGIRNT